MHNDILPALCADRPGLGPINMTTANKAMIGINKTGQDIPKRPKMFSCANRRVHGAPIVTIDRDFVNHYQRETVGAGYDEPALAGEEFS